jgi:hypothetical protein
VDRKENEERNKRHEADKRIKTDEEWERRNSTEDTDPESEDDKKSREEKEQKARDDFEATYETDSSFRNHNLKINSTRIFEGKVQPLRDEIHFNHTRDVIKAFDEYDANTVKIQEAKTEYEAEIYIVRDWVMDEHHHEYSTPEERQKILKNLTDQEEWIDLFGSESTKKSFKLKKREVKGTIAPIQLREKEFKNRRKNLDRYLRGLKKYNRKFEKLMLRKDWLTFNHTIWLEEELAINQAWIDKVGPEQLKRQKYEDPLFTFHDLMARAEMIGEMYKNLDKITMPPRGKKAKHFEMPNIDDLDLEFEEEEEIEDDDDENKKKEDDEPKATIGPDGKKTYSYNKGGIKMDNVQFDDPNMNINDFIKMGGDDDKKGRRKKKKKKNGEDEVFDHETL